MKQKIGDWTEQQFEIKVKKIVKDVVKDEVSGAIEKVKPDWVSQIEEKIRDIRPPWVDQMLELLDKSAGNYKKVDEAQELLSGRQSEHSDQINHLDTRVSKIEKHLQLPIAS